MNESTISLRAAQYLRMSTDKQEFSLENQADAIARYARSTGIQIVRTYQDAGKSGLTIRQRPGLQALLEDVVGGKAEFQVVLVHDVSRWGRFQDADEAAHYEFLCKRAGVPVRYCAEQFGADDTLPSRVMKALKRTMAAEFSRELGEKVYAGKARLAAAGFHQAGMPGYGLRRVMISADGRRTRQLRSGELKSLTTDRVILVPGTEKEKQCIRWIYRRYLAGDSVFDIVKELNLQGIPWLDGKRWNKYGVRQVLTNPKYAGRNTWGRTTQRLHARVQPNPPDRWISKEGAFEPIIEAQTFDCIQRMMTTKRLRKSNDEIVSEIKKLWRRAGRLSESLIDRTRGVPSCSTLRRRFGSMERFYALLGFRPATMHRVRSRWRRDTQHRHREIVTRILRECPGSRAMRLNARHREVVEFSGLGRLSVLVCRSGKERGGLRYWKLWTRAGERSLPTLVCLLKPSNQAIEKLYLVPNIDVVLRTKLTPGDPWFRRGVRISALRELPQSIAAVAKWVPLQVIPRRNCNLPVQVMGPPGRTHVHDRERLLLRDQRRAKVAAAGIALPRNKENVPRDRVSVTTQMDV